MTIREFVCFECGLRSYVDMEDVQVKNTYELRCLRLQCPHCGDETGWVQDHNLALVVPSLQS